MSERIQFRMQLSLLLLLFTATSLVQAALFRAKGPVVQLTGSNFKKEVLDIEKPTLVAFTAPWCGHCQKLVPEYEKAASTLGGIVKFANIDCDEDKNKATCGQYGIQGFPTIKMFPPTKKRIAKDYRGERTAKALADYAVGELPLAGVKKLEADKIDPFVASDPERVKLLLFTNKPSSSALYKSLALDFRRSITFASARGDQGPVRAAAKAYLGLELKGNADLPKLIMIPARHAKDGALAPFEKGSFLVYDGTLKYDVLREWIEDKGKELGAKKRSDKEMDNRKAPAEPTWAKPKEQPPPGASPPPGGAFEWKAENIEALNPKKAKNEKQEPKKKAHDGAAGMLSKERAQEILDRINQQKADLKEAADSVFDKAKDVGGSVAEKVSETVAESASAYADVLEDFADLVDPDRAAEKDDEKPSKDDGVYYDNAGQVVLDAVKGKLGKNLRETAGHAEELAYNMHGDASPDDEKPGEVLGAFAEYLSGKETIWSSDMTEQVRKAKEDAEKLFQKDPIEATKKALQQEEWLLKNLNIDREKMREELGDAGIKKLDELTAILKKRVADRGTTETDGKELPPVDGKPQRKHEEL